MNQPQRSSSGHVRRSAALALLAGGWIAVYWWWEPRREPPITFASLRPAPAEAPAERAPAQNGAARPRPQQSPSGQSPTEPAPTEQAPTEPAPPQHPPPAPAPEDPPPVVPAREYTVQRGDTLSAISKRFYGTTRHADVLYRANRARLKLRSPDAITAGDVLTIPPPPDSQER